jgi:Domain of unknown function (DUF4397)
LRRGVCGFLGLLLLSIGLGCGSSDGGGSNTASFRLVQASPDAPLSNVIIDGKTQSSNVSYGNATAYLSVKTGSRHLQLVPVNASKAIYDANLSFASNAKETLLLTGPVAQLQPITLTDAGTTPPSGDGSVRIINLSSKMGPADVYITVGNASLVGATPVTTSLAFGKDTGYQSVLAGQYQVFLTAPGTNNAYLSTGPLSITAAQNQTIVILDQPGGGFTFSPLQDQ